MKHRLIMENWRRFVNEAALGFGSEGLSELGDMTFRIENDGGYYTIRALDGSGSELGFVDLDDSYASDCGIFVTHSEITNPEKASFGPFLYDLAIELGTLVGSGVTSSSNPSGLTATDSEKSKSMAINVWTYYYERRADITKFPLTCVAMLDGRYILHKGMYIFPDHKHSHMIINTVKQGDKYSHKDPPSNLLTRVNAINHFYSKDPIFLDQLKAMGKLEDTANVLEEGARQYVKKG